MGKWIEFKELEQMVGKKTKHWVVKTTYEENRATLGIVKWYGSWRKYCFLPCEQTIFEWDCLREIADFCQQETKKYKDNNKEKVKDNE